MEEKNNQFDFSQPVDFNILNDEADPKNTLEDKKNTKTTLIAKKPDNLKHHHILLVVFVLLVGLIVAGAFSINQTLRIQELENKNLKNAQVAGISEEVEVENIIVGSGFSIITDQKTPASFELKTEFGKIVYLNLQGSTTLLLARQEKGGTELITGLEVHVVEYDNKLTNDSFLVKMQEYLGTTYVLDSNKVKVSGQFELNKLNPKSKDDPVYYTTVTADNYYIIKLYNQTAPYSEFLSETRFTDQLVPSLWLN